MTHHNGSLRQFGFSILSVNISVVSVVTITGQSQRRCLKSVLPVFHSRLLSMLEVRIYKHYIIYAYFKFHIFLPLVHLSFSFVSNRREKTAKLTSQLSKLTQPCYQFLHARSYNFVNYLLLLSISIMSISNVPRTNFN